MPSRNFFVGETVHLTTRVSLPGTKTPATAVVTLESLKLNGAVLTVADTTFDEKTKGEYILAIPTVGFAPGLYDLVVTVTGTVGGQAVVVKVPDSFVLKSL